MLTCDHPPSPSQLQHFCILSIVIDTMYLWWIVLICSWNVGSDSQLISISSMALLTIAPILCFANVNRRPASLTLQLSFITLLVQSHCEPGFSSQWLTALEGHNETRWYAGNLAKMSQKKNSWRAYVWHNYKTRWLEVLWQNALPSENSGSNTLQCFSGK